MCNCKNIEIGSYTNQTCIDIPNHMYKYKEYRIKNRLTLLICIDNCILEEIKYLWSLGIKTTGCCCGHNKLDGFIGVEFEDITKMKELGYKVQFNFSRPGDEDSFYLKYLNKEGKTYESKKNEIR